MTLDDQRIGAVEQLKIYAGILGLPMQVVPTADEAPGKLKALGPADVIVIDTPGVSPGEAGRRDEVQRTLAALACREVHLVLNACTREPDALAAVEGWKSSTVGHLAFTRLDEAGSCGSLLNLLIRTRLPLSYLGTGPRIPEDLAERPVEMLLSRVLPGALRGGGGPDAGPGRVGERRGESGGQPQFGPLPPTGLQVGAQDQGRKPGSIRFDRRGRGPAFHPVPELQP